MATSTNQNFGIVNEYDAEKEDWSSYIERIELFYVANDIEDEVKKRAILLSSCGINTYRLFKGLTAPAKPADKTFQELVTLMKNHQNPKRNPIAERYTFFSRNRHTNERVSDYMAELRRLSQYCEFGDTLDQMLRDRLVCGINHDRTQQRLLSEGATLTLQKALDISLSLESAIQQAAVMQHESQRDQMNAFKMSQKDNLSCYRCTGKHYPKVCPFINKECFFCKSKGHTEKVCRKKLKSQRQHTHPSNIVRESNESDENNEIDLLTIYHLNHKPTPPIIVEIEINNVVVPIEVDTGASTSLLNLETFKVINNSNIELQPTTCKLKTYSGEIITPKGVAEINFSYEGNKFQGKFIITDNKSPNVLGRDILGYLRLNWKQLFNVFSLSENCKLESLTLNKILSEYKTVFNKELGTLKDVEITIPINPSVKPKFFRARPVPYALKEKIEIELKRLVDQGIYEPITSSQWAAPIVPVVKPDGSIRICGDYKQTVNQVADCDKYPIPKTEDIFATLNGGEKFTKLDLSQAYQQLVLNPDSRNLLTINTHKGLFRPTRLQFGVHSASGIFQRELESRVAHIPFVKVRSDDILISGKNDSEHLNNLNEVLKVIKQNGLRLKLEKCKFMANEVIYLGFKINKYGVYPIKEKIDSIKNAKEPQNVSELKSFLGLLNYYHRYFKDFSEILEPLHKLLRKGEKWEWTHKQIKAFEHAKSILSENSILVHYDPSKPIQLACDASPFGLGAVLSHIMPDGTEQPISYTSRTLSKAERNYSQIEKEALAIIYAVKKFHQYLYGRKFILLTDHKPLLGLLAENKAIPSMAAARIQRWAITLSAYNYTLKYRPGSLNSNADFFSRYPSENLNEEQSTITNNIFLTELSHSPITSTEISYYSKHDSIISLVIEYTLTAWPNKIADRLKPYFYRKNELSIENSCLLWGNRIIVPLELQTKVLDELHDNHPGITRMKALARSFVWWPAMDKAIEQKVKSCQSCQLHQAMPAKAPIHPWESPEAPWVRLHIDYAGPFLGKMFFILYDSYSKWVDVFPMKNISANLTINCLRHSFSTHGLPHIIVSDNGPSFISNEFKNFCSLNGIKHVTTAPYHPSSNGPAERAVQTFKTAIKKIFENSVSDVNSSIYRFLLSYRSTPHSVTGKTPAELLFNRKLKTRLSLLKPHISSIKDKEEKHLLSFHELSKNTRNFYPGDLVWVRNFQQRGDKWIKGTIIKRISLVLYEVQLLDGRLVKKHIDQIRCQPVFEAVNDETNPENKQTNEHVIQSPIVPQTINIPETESMSQTDQQNPIQSPSEAIEHDNTKETELNQNEHFSNNDRSQNVAQTNINNRPKRIRRPPAYLRDYET